MKYMVEDGGRFTKTTRGNSGLGPWKNISREIYPMKLIVLFPLGMVLESDYGRTLGVGSTPLVFPFQICSC